MTHSDILLTQRTIELVIFDCDGVLIDSEILSKRVLLNMLSDLGVKLSDDYFYSHFLGYNFEHVTAKVFADFSVVLTNDFRQRYRQALLEVFATELKTTVEVESILSQLTVNSCVATSSSPEKVSNALKYTQLAKFFNGRVFTSSEVEQGKPAPDLFLHAAKTLGVKPEHCLVIEDSQTGINAGLAANMQVIRYAGASHMQGINTDSKVLEGVNTIAHWNQLFSLVPSINPLHHSTLDSLSNSSFKVQR